MLILKSIMESLTKMNYEKDFDMIDAFMALKDLDDDSVTGMISSKKSSGRKLHEGKGYPIHASKDALEAARNFLNENDEMALEVIDPDADSLEHIKDRIDYVGQMILRCNRCQANRFIDMDALVENPEEKGVYNIDDECPNCKTSGVGYEIIGQVGKYEEPEAEEAEAEDAESSDSDEATEEEAPAEEEVAIENDSQDADELKFDNDEADLETTEDESEDAQEVSDEVVEIEDTSDELEDPDMMETDSSEDDEDDIDVEEDEDDDDEEVKESLYRPALYEDADKAAEYKKEAMMYDKIMDQMADDGAQDAWEAVWPKYQSKVSNLATPDIVDLKDEFEEIYRKYHNGGLIAAEADVIKTCAALDKEFGLANIENHRTYVESATVIQNTTISEVLGSILDADKVGRIEITNKCDNKKDQKVYDGDYNNLPLNLANSNCTCFDVNNRTLACNIDQDENHGRRPLADILDKFGDDKSDNIHIYDIASSDEIFKGKKSDAIEKFGKCGFISIDTPAVIRMTICNPSIVCADCCEEGSDEDKLVEHIITENELSITRLSKVNSNEYWIRESIRDKEDLEIIYETYVKPCGKHLVEEFKKVTGYSNAIDEAFEAGYAAAKGEAVEEIDESMNTETYESFMATCYADTDENIAFEDYATVTIHPDGTYTVEGDQMFSDGKTNIVDALVDAAQSMDTYMYAGVSYAITDELDEIITPEQRAEIAARLDCIVEELEEDLDQEDTGEEVEEQSEVVDEAFMSRDAMISDLRKIGKNYYFDKYSDEQIYMIHKRAIQQAVNKKAPNKSLSAKMDDLIADESDAIKQYDAAIDTVNASDAANKDEIIDTLNHIRDEEIEHIDELQNVAECDRCGARLNDGGTCPHCDDGEEDMFESFDFDKLYSEIIKSNDPESTNEGIIASYLFNSELAHGIYDEFYKPLTDLIKAGDKEAALKEWEELKKDFEADGLDKKRWAKLFVDIQNERLAKYKEQIDAIEVDSEEFAAISESLSTGMRSIIADSINHMINDLGYDANDEEFPDDVLADIEDNYDDVNVPTEPRAYAAWASEIFAEIARQVSMLPECVTESVDDEWEDWVDEPTEEPQAQEPMDKEVLRQLVNDEMPFAMSEWGTSMKGLTNHFLTIMEEAGFQMPTESDLKDVIGDYLADHATDLEVDESFTSFKSRKDLADAITECKNNSRPYTIRRSIREGYRYDLIVEADKSNKQDDAAKESSDVEKEVIDLKEGDNLPAPAEENSVSMTAEEAAVNANIMRISQDISNAIYDVYGIEADPALIVADILQDLGLIAGTVRSEDLADTALNRATIEMYNDHEAFWIFMNHIVTAITGQPMEVTPEAKIKRAVKMLSGPNFSTLAIRKGIESRDFQMLVAQGKVPFVPAGSRPLLGEDVESSTDEVEVNVEKFDSDMNEYFREAYEEPAIYTTTSGHINEDGSIVLKGEIMTESASMDLNFVLNPETALTESLSGTESDIRAKLESLDYIVTNDKSSEVFEFNFND